MDTDWLPMQGSNLPAVVDPNSPDWRAHLQPETRSRIVSRIVETLKKHPPVSGPVGLTELQRDAVRFEEEIYTAATNQSYYWREISVKMLSMETKTEQAPGNAHVIPNQNNPGQASENNIAQTGHAGVGDWQEEVYQMIKGLKGIYFAELNELFNKISVKLQYVESTIPPQGPFEQYERMKSFKIMLERILQILHISKSAVQPALRDKLPQYEKQIIHILNSLRRKPVQPQV
ncbi:hypothetical protein ACQ4PT_066230 [Festuca glaucescens]